MRHRIPWGYAFIAYITIGTSGCGFLFVHGPPADHAERSELFSCTESNIGPILDVIWAGLNATGIILYAADAQFRDDVESASVAFSAGWVALNTSAAIVGFNKTSKCREARLAQNRRLRAGSGDREDGVGTLMLQAPDATETVWGRVAQWSDPLFPEVPDRTPADTTAGR